MSHLMLDLETLGNQSYSCILSIAAVEFDIETGEELSFFYKKISLESNLQLGLKINSSTLEWWMLQKPEVLRELFTFSEPINSVLYDFQSYLTNFKLEGLWGNSARFDCGILQNAYNKADIPLPWDFRKERCYRTFVEMFGQIDKTKYIGFAHNPLDDCRNQITTLMYTKNNLKYV